MKYTVIKRRRHDRVEPKHNYLKYFRVVRHWMKIKYDIGLPELEMLLFLHAEDYQTYLYPMILVFETL